MQQRSGAVPGLIMLAVILFVLNLVFGWVAIPMPSMPTSSEVGADTPEDFTATWDSLPEGTEPCHLGEGKEQDACEKAKVYAYEQLGGDDKQFLCLDQLWIGESQWNAWAYNPDTTPSGNARGIPQIMDELYPEAKEMVGDWKAQVDWGLNYIKNRDEYGTPCKTLELWNSRNPHWY